MHEKLRKGQTSVEPEPGSVSAAEGDAIAENMESMAVRIEAIAQKLSQD